MASTAPNFAAGGPASEHPFDVLTGVLNLSLQFSAQRARWFGIIYYGLRLCLITLSALVAATNIPALASRAQYLALIVAIGTAIDTWLQPGVKYKAHYTYNDEFRALEADLFLVGRQDLDGLASLKERWHTLDAEYRKAVLPL